MLERRVDERTAELQRLNAELERAKNEADAANLSKTRFLAAASHDILQPLNAARLYASSLTEGGSQIGAEERVDLARSGDGSLEAWEAILGELDISRLWRPPGSLMQSPICWDARDRACRPWLGAKRLTFGPPGSIRTRPASCAAHCRT
jgi:light-regulated signal transduction histidine kinase (bacteriophytochrome)